jgi:hypothetical protein
VFQAHQVNIQGSPKYFEKKADSGNDTRRGFCPDCGTPLFSGNAKMKGVICIIAGSLDDSSWFKPSVDIWTDSAMPWVMENINPETKEFGKNPPSPIQHKQ